MASDIEIKQFITEKVAPFIEKGLLAILARLDDIEKRLELLEKGVDESAQMVIDEESGRAKIVNRKSRKKAEAE